MVSLLWAQDKAATFSTYDCADPDYPFEASIEKIRHRLNGRGALKNSLSV